MKKIIFIFALCIFSNSKAQSGFETIFLADKNDSEKIIEQYFSPKINGYLNGLNNAWFYTAKAHIPFGFDISVNLVNVITPEVKDTFRINNLTSVNSPNGVLSAQTSTGKDVSTPFSVSTTVNNQNVTANTSLSGGNSKSSIPIAQLSVGVNSGFDIMLRFTPDMKPNNTNESLSTFGFGIKKEITKLFKKSDKLPLHVAILAGYNSMTVNYGIENQDFPSGNNTGIQVQNAITAFKLHSFTLQTIASLDWKTISVFGGVGYNTGSANLTVSGILNGQYEGNQNPETKALAIPENIKFNSNSFSANIGSKINLRYLKIFGGVTIQEFNTVNLGVAFHIK